MLVAVLSVALFGAGAAEARGYKRIYKISGLAGMTVVVDGNANAPMFCNALNGGLNGTRTASHPGRAYCGWQMRMMDVRVFVWSSNALNGRVFCQLMRGKIASGDRRRVL